MKELQNLNTSRLSVLEIGQHIKSILKNLKPLGSIITDIPFKNYLQKLEDLSTEYDKAMLHIAKSDETAKINQADKARDIAITATLRFLNVFELSEDKNELEAYESLNNLFNVYKGIQRWNLEEETNGIDNLLKELNSPKYAAHVATIEMKKYINRIEAKQNIFVGFFDNRTQEDSSKETYDVPSMRKEITSVNNDLNDYVLSQAKALDTNQFNDSLKVINTVRKYYADLLAKRRSSNDDGDNPIPPME